ncbi:MAG: response regulator [Solirubrobacteraceae bacterium]
MRVVVVDDQPVFRNAARDLVMARGSEIVAEAACAASAVEAVECHQPNAMLLDVQLRVVRRGAKLIGDAISGF